MTFFDNALVCYYIILLVLATCSFCASVNQAALAALFEAIAQDDVIRANQMFTDSFNNNYEVENDTNWRPLHVAAYYGCQTMTQFLLGNDVELMPSNSNLEKPIHLASMRGQDQIIKMLLSAAEQKPETGGVASLVEAKQIDGQTPLFYTAKASPSDVSKNVILELLQQGANMFHVDANGLQPVHFAVTRKHVPLVEQLLRAGGERVANAKCCPQSLSTDGKTISHMAAEYNFVEMVTSLKDYYNDSSLDDQGQSPPCYAAKNGSAEFARNIINSFRGVSNCIYGNQWSRAVGSPLHVAAFYRRGDFVHLLLEDIYKGHKEFPVDSQGGTPVHAMATNPEDATLSVDNDIIKEFFDRDALIVDARDNMGRTPFLLASQVSAINLANSLYLTFGALPTSVDMFGFSAVHLAQAADFIHYLLSRIRAFSDVNGRSLTGMTPLLVAVKEKKAIGLISFLVKNGADKTAVNSQNQNAVHLAVEVNYIQALDTLRQWSFDFSAQDNNGRTPLLYSVMTGKTDAAENLINKGSRDSLLEILPGSQESVLHLVASRNYTRLAQLLLAKDNQLVNMQNKRGETPFLVAVYYQNIDLVKMLIASGSSLTAQDNNKRNALHLLTIRCGTERVKVAQMILSQNGGSVLLDGVDDFGDSVVRSAVKRNAEDLFQLFSSTRPSICQESQQLTSLAESNGFNALADVISEQCQTSHSVHFIPRPSPATIMAATRKVTTVTTSTSPILISWNGVWWASGCSFKGGDIGSVAAPSIECNRKCELKHGCTHFAFTKYRGGTCWLKGGNDFLGKMTKDGNLEHTCGFMYWNKNKIPSKPTKNLEWQGVSWTWHCDIPGDDIEAVKIPGTKCSRSCELKSGCTHFARDKDGTCFLKGGGDGNYLSKLISTNAKQNTVCGIVHSLETHYVIRVDAHP